MPSLSDILFKYRITGSVGGTTSLLGTISLGYIDMTPASISPLTINLGLDARTPPPGYIRALPGIVNAEWSFDPDTNEGFYNEQGADGPPTTVCIDSDLALHLYPGSLVPGQLVAVPPESPT